MASDPVHLGLTVLQERVSVEDVEQVTSFNLRTRAYDVEFCRSCSHTAEQSGDQDRPRRFKCRGDLRNEDVTVLETGVSDGYIRFFAHLAELLPFPWPHGLHGKEGQLIVVGEPGECQGRRVDLRDVPKPYLPHSVTSDSSRWISFSSSFSSASISSSGLGGTYS